MSELVELTNEQRVALVEERAGKRPWHEISPKDAVNITFPNVSIWGAADGVRRRVPLAVGAAATSRRADGPVPLWLLHGDVRSRCAALRLHPGLGRRSPGAGMRSNCRCGYDADPSIFGPCRDCSPKPPPDASALWPFERRIEQAEQRSDR